MYITINLDFANRVPITYNVTVKHKPTANTYP